MPPCRLVPLVRAGGPRDVSCRSARRRSPTRSSRRMRLGEPGSRATRSTSRSARCARLVQITETVPPERAVPRLRLLLVVLRHDAPPRHRPRRRARSPSGELGAASLVVEAASNDGYLLQYYHERRRPGARHRAGRNIAAVAQRARHPDARRVLRPRARGAPRRRGDPRRRVPRPQRPRARPRPERLRRRHRDRSCAEDGVAVIEVPYVQGHARPLRVRHDLPRAPLLLLAHRARPAVPPPRAGDLPTSSGCRSTAARCGSVQRTRLVQSADESVARDCSPRRSRGARRRAEPYLAFRGARRRDPARPARDARRPEGAAAFGSRPTAPRRRAARC